MPMHCPTCHLPLDPALACPTGHQFSYQDGVLVLLDAAFARRLQAFSQALHTTRAEDRRPVFDKALYNQLPCAPALQINHEWRNRCGDLALLTWLLRGRGPLRVLDVGAWSGWLSHQLARLGHAVTGVDYFADHYDGLGAHRLSQAAWRPIQLDLADLDVLDQTFDLVVLNRCLAFFPEPAQLVAAAQRRLAAGGLLLITGMEFYRNPAARVAYVAELRQRHMARTGQELFLRPTRGYLDQRDRAKLTAMGVTLRHYPRLWAANLKARLHPTKPEHLYGMFRENYDPRRTQRPSGQ